MVFNFCKMQGLGNDYVYIDLFSQQLDADWPELAKVVSDRHFGIGGDGLILICPGTAARVRMRMFNADGSEAQMCGNGIRCTAKYAYEHGLLADEPANVAVQLPLAVRGFSASPDAWRVATIETGAGVLTVWLEVTQGHRVERVCVDMGEPILEPAKIPVKMPGKTIVAQTLRVGAEQRKMTCVSMGNPHAVIFTDEVETVDLDRLGPLIERHELFPERTNVHFATTASSDRVKMVTWERGSGRTLACGTGACAVVVAGVLEKRLDRSATVALPGGELKINWNGDDGHVYMLGPAVTVFNGVWSGSV
jgi:diaminopimelate epimerase